MENQSDYGPERAQATELVRLGNIAINRAEYAAALDYLHEAQDIADRIDDFDLQVSTLGQLEHALSELGDLPAALEANSVAMRLAEGSGDTKALMFAVNSRGCSLIEMGHHDEAWPACAARTR